MPAAARVGRLDDRGQQEAEKTQNPVFCESEAIGRACHSCQAGRISE